MATTLVLLADFEDHEGSCELLERICYSKEACGGAEEEQYNYSTSLILKPCDMMASPGLDLGRRTSARKSGVRPEKIRLSLSLTHTCPECR